jgi:hypothetical protein
VLLVGACVQKFGSNKDCMPRGRLILWRKQIAWVLTVRCIDTSGVNGENFWVRNGRVREWEGNYGSKSAPTRSAPQPLPGRFCLHCLAATVLWLTGHITPTHLLVVLYCVRNVSFIPCAVRMLSHWRTLNSESSNFCNNSTDCFFVVYLTTLFFSNWKYISSNERV